MALAIHRASPYAIDRQTTGWPVFAVQRVLNKGYSVKIVEDMAFGDITERAVKLVQKRRGIKQDGVVGPQTQASIADDLCARYEKAYPDIPAGLLPGVVAGESGKLIAAVSWGSPGGVDCGYTQKRVYDSDYDDEAAIRRAFDAVYQVGLLANNLTDLSRVFLPRAGVDRNRELAWRLAVLNHNYPLAADQISRKGIAGLSSYWTSPQQWVRAIGARWNNDKSSVDTPLEWCQYYALGSAEHHWPGFMTREVMSWT